MGSNKLVAVNSANCAAASPVVCLAAALSDLDSEVYQLAGLVGVLGPGDPVRSTDSSTLVEAIEDRIEQIRRATGLLATVRVEVEQIASLAR